ncbi:MAG: bifunctional diaminohydroxyphosphoribosylaminopyrimidine deaminase/5-amino-6-(5-phosphoribosylamino)uracil reductase RibD [Chlorobi bacterium]|nr:bifunctional diaminohydroxyphosphoribosylaminopyrimidine deaminase/5-amino-6-(5-phosphoribosylamino)uracil reductase RibD [Chlorobiota bacterium]
MHKIYMKRCILLAKNGQGNVAPNPMVGSVIVYNNKIIGEGYHQNFGDSHAEVNAINSVKNKDLLKKATLYVNLEPCSHYGKTPPCTDLILKHKIPNVVIGCVDEFAKVAGRGVLKLRNSDVNVTLGVLEKESKELNRRFFTFHNKKRPYIILKWAQTLDGFIDIKRTTKNIAEPMWITNEIARSLVHKWRTEEAAIMIGTNTAEKDNPNLNVRNVNGNNPLRIVLDRNMRLPVSLHVFNQQIPTIIFTQENVPDKKNLEYVKINFEGHVIEQILSFLYKKNILSVIIEGGEKLINSFMKQFLWDEARIFIGDKLFYNGVKAPDIMGVLTNNSKIEESKLLIFRNK